MPCPACGSREATVFFCASGALVLCNVLCETREEALAAPRGEIRLAHCHGHGGKGGCGLVYNEAFEPALMRYTGRYENALHFSGHFQAYADVLARDLIARRGVRGKRIVEIGCGDASFLRALCDLGENEGIGFDPAHDEARAGAAAPANGEAGRGRGGVRVFKEMYGPGVAERVAGAKSGGWRPDLVVCRHTLEHVERPVEFLREVRRAVEGVSHGQETGVTQNRAIIFFEVPNALWTLEQMGIWDVIYEHVLYFTPRSLWRAFELAGLTPVRTESVYGGQFLTIEAVTGDPSTGAAANPPSDEGVPALAAAFGKRHTEIVARWRDRLRTLAARGARAALWGAGSKGVTFLNTMGEDAAAISCAVDLNPRKHGCYIAGTGQRIVPPEELRPAGRAGGEAVDLVIVMNPLYAGEIREKMRALGVSAEVEVA